MLLPQNLQVYAGRSTVSCLDLDMGQGDSTPETQTAFDSVICAVALTRLFQFAVPLT